MPDREDYTLSRVTHHAAFFIIFTGMRTIQLLLCSILVWNVSFAQKLRYKVLFLGNSYTYVNNLPDLVKGVALANGDSLIYDSNCIGGFTFGNHFNDPTTKSKIMAGGWDYVVLQAQSQEPSFSPAQVAAQTLPYAIKLDSMIKQYNPCAITVYYETWGRKNGDASNCAFYPPVCTYTGMQNRLKASYKLFADSAHAILAPAGEAFRACVSTNTSINLYQADESHPSLEGSFLTAAVFYETLFRKSVLSNTYNPGVSSSTATLLQSLAHQTFRDSLALWNIGRYSPWAGFTYSINGAQVQFYPQVPQSNGVWFFGDGASSLQANTSHSYLPGTYTVSRVTKRGCKTDSTLAIITITANPTGVTTVQNLGVEVKEYPNPTNGSLYLETANPGLFETILISDLLGKTMIETLYQKEIDISHLPDGVYVLSIQGPGRQVHKKLVVKH